MPLKSPIKLVLCPIKNPEKKYEDYFLKIYKCWHEIWSKTYAEVNYHSNEELTSDSFSRQDFAAAFFVENECAAFVLFRYADLDLVTTYEDSFFLQWSEIHRAAVARIGKKVLICGNLGIAPQFRSSSFDVSLKELIVGLVVEITLNSPSDVTIATPRRDKNVHSSSYKWGAVPIAQDVDWGCGVHVDLVAFYKDHLIKNCRHDLIPFINDLWDNKLVIGSLFQETLNNYNNFKKASSFNIPIKKNLKIAK